MITYTEGKVVESLHVKVLRMSIKEDMSRKEICEELGISAITFDRICAQETVNTAEAKQLDAKPESEWNQPTKSNDVYTVWERNGFCSGKELADKLGMSRKSISYHLDRAWARR